jgi:two-component system, NtrC family, sensor kinase
MMTLRRKLAYQIATLIGSLLVIGVASLWGINAMRTDFSAALDGYQRLRKLYEVATHVEVARMLMGITHPEPASARAELERAADVFNTEFPPDADAAQETAVRHAFENATRSGATEEITTSTLESIIQPMVDLDAQYRQAIQIAQNHADRGLKLLMICMVILLAGVAMIAMIIGVAQYRTILWPLARMKLAVERIAAGRFNGRVHSEGTAEFVELAANFNRMAARLEDLYHTLQQRVDSKSRQLLRNERLASVGLLAAGVAHEINNPLNIMTAHAELSLGAIERGDESAQEESARSLQVICEEAFRCKRIVEKLLTLGRGPKDPSSVFSLGNLVREVVETVSAMPNYSDRNLIVEPTSGADDRVKGRSDEIKQVVLNLLFNALEATSAGGEVRVAITADRREVELRIADTGRGMADAVLEQVFEPFFTDPRGKTIALETARRGTGLGLSIAHAIIVRHGGEIRAHSDGPGLGSQFTVIFPTASFDVDEEVDE